MTRPEHVRCENCAYWKHGGGPRGECERYPDAPIKFKGDGCGEFAEAWPVEDRA